MAQQEGVCLLSTNSFSQLIENPIANIIMLLVAVWLLYKALPKVKALYKNKKEDEKIMYVSAYVATIPTAFFAGLYFLQSGWNSVGFIIVSIIAVIKYIFSKGKGSEALEKALARERTRKAKRKVKKEKNVA